MKYDHVTFEFVELMPAELKPGVVYVSMPFATASHLCLCGCGEKVVTPFSPTDWKLTFDGESISISPSIGNWDFRCKSHYWISRNKVHWAPVWSKEQVLAAGQREDAEKEAFFTEPPQVPTPPREAKTSGVKRILRFLGLRK